MKKSIKLLLAGDICLLMVVGALFHVYFVSHSGPSAKETAYQDLCDRIKENPSYLSNWLPYDPEEEEHILSLSGELAYYTAGEDGFKKSDCSLYALLAEDRVVTICAVSDDGYSTGDTRVVGYLDYWHEGEAVALIDDARGFCAVSVNGTITRLTDIYVSPDLGYAECTSEYVAEHFDELTFTYCYPHEYLSGNVEA